MRRKVTKNRVILSVPAPKLTTTVGKYGYTKWSHTKIQYFVAFVQYSDRQF